MDEFTVVTDANGIASAVDQVVPGALYKLDVIPPSGYRDAPDKEVTAPPDGQVLRTEPFQLEAQRSTFEVPVLGPGGAGLAGVTVRFTRVG